MKYIIKHINKLHTLFMFNKIKKNRTSNFRGNCEGEASASKFITDSIFFNIFIHCIIWSIFEEKSSYFYLLTRR